MTRPTVSRRRFLKSAVVAAGPASAAWLSSAAGAEPQDKTVPKPGPGRVTRLSDHLAVYYGPINVGVLLDGDRAMLIDCGDARVADQLEKLGASGVDQVLFTHHHRDQACGVGELVRRGAKLRVGAAERNLFDDVAAYWANPRSRWHIYNLHPHHLALAESVPVAAALQGGDRIEWGPARIEVLDTPGHTDGSISYLVEVDGRRVVFSGDAIYDHGQVWDVHSLQKGFQRDKRRISDYHGFLGAQWELVESLGRIKEAKPELLVPSHGNIMRDPPAAIDTLVKRLAECYDRYVAISALRHYFPELFSEFAGRKDHMAIRPGIAVPDCLRHFGTTWMLVSQNKAALVMDCGNARVVPWLKEQIDKGEIRVVEGLWVTHYHDDHVDAIPEFQKAFDCPCIADRHVAQVIGTPEAWRLPCISPSKARVDRPTADGDSWTWHEFRLTAFHFPGQTLYHGALLAERGDLKMLFVGDSHTAAGIDDYCSSNRNWLGAGVGFDRCIALIDKLRPTHIFNCHVADAFTFTPEECRFMRENLAAREKLFGELVPWDHANYGMDEPWVRCNPYQQTVAPGGHVELQVVITNHSSKQREAACRAVLPAALGGKATEWTAGTISAKAEQGVPLSFTLPADAKPGRHVVAIDLRYNRWDLPQFTEAIVVV